MRAILLACHVFVVLTLYLQVPALRRRQRLSKTINTFWRVSLLMICKELSQSVDKPGYLLGMVWLCYFEKSTASL